MRSPLGTIWRRTAALTLAVSSVGAACGKARRAAAPEAAEAADPAAAAVAVAGPAEEWPAHGQELPPQLAADARGLPGHLVLAVGPALWRLELAAGRVSSLAALTASLGPEITLFPTAAGQSSSVWIASRGHDAEHVEQLAVAQGGKARLLGPAAQQVRHATLTPDGGHVIFESSHQSFRDLYMLELESGALARLTDNREGNFEPTLSADGKTLAFSSSRDGDSEIYALTVPAKLPAALPAAQRLTAFHRDDFSPVFGPLGRLAFVSDREGADRIFVVRPDGTELLRVTSEREAGAIEAAPAWSPAGALAYVRTEKGRSELRAGAPGTTAWQRLTPPEASALSYAWSPDGDWLVALEVPWPSTSPTGRLTGRLTGSPTGPAGAPPGAGKRVRAQLWASHRDGQRRVLVLAEVDADAVVRWLPAPAVAEPGAAAR